MKYQIKNWDKFQQYKDDRPVHWIKLHNCLIDDYHFEELTEQNQLYLIKLWLFASKNKGRIEGSDAFIARKIGAKKLKMETLVKAGFIIRTDSYDTVQRNEKSVPRGEERRGEKKGRFTPPTVKEIEDYCRERSNDVDAQKFMDHYEANGWMRGKAKIKNWKACVRTWETKKKQQEEKWI